MRVFLPAGALWVCLFPNLAQAVSQGEPVTGLITDSVTASPLAGARIEVRGPAGPVVLRVETDARGRFRLSIPDGLYDVAASAVGYEPWRGARISFRQGGKVALTIRMVPRPALLAPVEVVAREPQSLIDAPAAVSVIENTPQSAVVVSPVRLLEKDPGISMARKGLTQATFAARGPSAVNSAALIVLQDYRLASVPSLRLNVPYLMPASMEDLERIEVTRGPSAVVYGADADRGVVNFITRSPFASQGTTITTMAGNRSIHQIGLRHAGRLGEALAFKFSGEYFKGTDWHTVDSRESRPRDERIERAAGEARLDWQADDRTLMIFTGGLAQAINNVDLTEIGSIQVRNWRYTFGQARLLRERLFVNLFLNQNDAGQTFQLYSGDPIVDQSRTLSAQIQHGSVLSNRVDLTYGADLQRVQPRTEGTIHGRNEDRDDITLAGVHLSSTTPVSPKLSLVGSLRADHHSRLDDLALSPRLGLVFQPGRLHAVRLTFNRATSTPVANDLFLDLRVRDTIGGSPYSLRARGTAEGYTFRRDCNGLCMRSPFLGDATAFIPADATILWPWVVGYLQTRGIDLSMLPPPGAQVVATTLGILNLRTEAFDPVSFSSIRDIPAARRSYTSTIEAGYRGELSPSVSLSFDVYHSRLSNVMNPLSVQTPNAFLDRDMLEAYLANFIPAQTAATLADSISLIPLGIITPEQGDSTEIIALGRQGARASFWGADASLSVRLHRFLTLNGTLSWTSKDRVASRDGFSDIVFNAPRTKGGVGLAFNHPGAGLVLELRGRAVSGFPVESGEFSGRVSAYAAVDATASYRLPWAPALSLTVSIDNLLNERHREFVGAPVLGRLLLGRVRADF